MNMADETISEKCETLYNKLNTFVTSVISRDVTPKIANLNTEVWGSDTQTGNSRIDTLNTNFNNLDSSITSMGSNINNVESDVSNLQTSVNSLSDSINTTETTTITPSNVSGANIMNFALWGGKFVKLSWIDNSVTVTSSSVGSYKVLGTLPEKYRPTTQTWFTQAYSLNLDKGRQTSLCIMPNGQIHLYCWWTGTNQATPCLFTGIYALF